MSKYTSGLLPCYTSYVHRCIFLKTSPQLPYEAFVPASIRVMKFLLEDLRLMTGPFRQMSMKRCIGSEGQGSELQETYTISRPSFLITVGTGLASPNQGTWSSLTRKRRAPPQGSKSYNIECDQIGKVDDIVSNLSQRT
jgi:hypothetical protein